MGFHFTMSPGVKAKLTTNSPKIWRCWRNIGRDLASSVERIARPCSLSAAVCMGSLRAKALGRQLRSRGRNTRSLRMEGPLSGSPLPSRKIGSCGDSGHLDRRVRSDAKHFDNPGAQVSHLIPHCTFRYCRSRSRSDRPRCIVCAQIGAVETHKRG
jgi:hypothetical protein